MKYFTKESMVSGTSSFINLVHLLTLGNAPQCVLEALKKNLTAAYSLCIMQVTKNSEDKW